MSVYKLEFLSFKSRMFPQINIRSMKRFTRDLKMVIFSEDESWTCFLPG